jgi:thioesterase domain-containing protein/aryl carrier-like protein
VERLKPKHSLATIGDPIANTALYVLDAKRQLAPVGATGELVIGGDGVAAHRGAVINDFPGAGSAPLYPTGDLARLRADGCIEYLGRSDFRFTHHGRLIDPTDIERVLLRHAEVAEATVIQPGLGLADSSLTAFIVPRTAQKNDSAELIESLRTALNQNLPNDLVPATFIVRGSLPRMLDGTVDRAALRWTRPPTAVNTAAGVKPAGDIELRLAALWKSMLTVDTVAPEDNFFELGGHSLLAARMLTRVEREFGRRIKLATLFSAPTLRQFAQVLAHDDLREFDFRQVVKVQPSGSKIPIIAVNNTGNYYLLAKYLGLDQPFISLQLFDPSINHAHMPETLEQVATGYVELIRRVQPTGPYRIMGWCVAGALAFEIARQLTAAELPVADLYLIDSWVPRYISRQPFPRRLISDYTLRWQLFYADWRKMRAGHQTFAEFVSNRIVVQKFKRTLANGQPPRWDEWRSEAMDFSRENYDLWLLHYLQGLTDVYQPGMYEGRLTLFRSTLEPTGWFFDPLAGWGQFVRRGVGLHIVTGDHHTMFQDPGATEMAQNIADASIVREKTATP